MTRIKSVGKKEPRVRSTSPAEPRVDPREVAAALGASCARSIQQGFAEARRNARRHTEKLLEGAPTVEEFMRRV